MDQSEHCKEVYAHFGLALYCAQVLEQAIIHALIFLDLIPNSLGTVSSREEWQRKFDQFFEKEQQKTMGQLLRKLRALGQVTDKLELCLKGALIERNRLAHSYFWEHAENFMNQSGRDKMISELQRLCELFTEAEILLSDSMQTVCSQYGFTPEKYIQMEKEYMKIKGIKCDL